MNGDRVLGSNKDASTYSCAKVLLSKRCSGRSVALRSEEVRQRSPRRLHHFGKPVLLDSGSVSLGSDPGPAAHKIPAKDGETNGPGKNAGPFYCNPARRLGLYRNGSA
jgi:hypothetical protein